jgi:hypothetical protein
MSEKIPTLERESLVYEAKYFTTWNSKDGEGVLEKTLSINEKDLAEAIKKMETEEFSDRGCDWVELWRNGKKVLDVSGAHPHSGLSICEDGLMNPEDLRVYKSLYKELYNTDDTEAEKAVNNQREYFKNKEK